MIENIKKIEQVDNMLHDFLQFLEIINFKEIFIPA